MGGRIVASGAALMFVGVALGAFGAHGLRERITPEMLAVYQTGVQYHLVHAVALLILGVWAGPGGASNTDKAARIIAALFAVGILLFSGSLYALAISGVRALGAITPLGGVCFLTAWAIWAVNAARNGANAAEHNR